MENWQVVAIVEIAKLGNEEHSGQPVTRYYCLENMYVRSIVHM